MGTFRLQGLTVANPVQQGCLQANDLRSQAHKLSSEAVKPRIMGTLIIATTKDSSVIVDWCSGENPASFQASQSTAHFAAGRAA